MRTILDWLKNGYTSSCIQPIQSKMESVFSPLASGLGSSLDLTKDTKGEVILCPFKAYTLRKPAFLCNFSWRYSKPGLDCCRMKGKAQLRPVWKSQCFSNLPSNFTLWPPQLRSLKPSACVHAKSLSHVQLCSSLLWTVDCQASLSMGFSRQEYWSRLPRPPPGDLSDPGIESTSLVSPALQAGSLPLVPPGKPQSLVQSPN